MAVKIERGGWALICLVGVGLVGYALNKYGLLDIGKFTGKSGSSSSAKVDTAKPLDTTASGGADTVRVRLNIWVGCVGGLVANGGLDTAANIPGAELRIITGMGHDLPPALYQTFVDTIWRAVERARAA